MADVNEDPREVPWHPRFAKAVVGHQAALAQFAKAFTSGKPHHAWLIHGPKGIGKATLAYHLASQALGGTPQARHWIESRAHPDLFVLERQLNDSKPRRLKAEISVEDARGLGAFLSRTAATNWRVVLIDAADDLNRESANSILKLVEEPPPKTLIFLISHQPGKLLRTLKSRCLRLPLQTLSVDETINTINKLPLEQKPSREDVSAACARVGGSPGLVLAVMGSAGAKAFDAFAASNRPKLSALTQIANDLGAKGQGPDAFKFFSDMLLDHLAKTARASGSAKVAEAHQALSQNLRIAEAFNLDRKQAAFEAMRLANDALKQT